MQKKFHQILFSWIPFSFGDLLYIILIAVIIHCIVTCFKKKSRHNAFIRLLIMMNIIYFSYQIFWGMLYFQNPIIDKLPKGKITLNDRKDLALHYLEKCKNSRELVKENSDGVFRIGDITSIENEILKEQNKLPAFITNKKNDHLNSFKPSLFKDVMSFTGILGYYNPFTAEAQYNSRLPSSYLPFTLAHESAHQLGFAREQEANFIGYLAGKNSGNPDLKYSTEYFVLKSLLNSIVYEDEDFVKAVLEKYSAAMKRDRAFEKRFLLEHQGWLDHFFGFTNNLFLKTNQQEGSVTYSYFVELLVKYEK
ncbi:DUF3810 domain-containing protein [Chryseobacterium sp. GMJ5]|uniref:DUF3810 domain-containing protein n=1 Tax=Chryseobacterium gilvum TaxID=2976534 RepID=A0ABT2VZX3_9FLAO|nr:DUF3810 domain-containing protein [Chryseobacterium gilvum]MCU7615547.1 DUF3810 domain-containing protein [Chryseobacterium gilvum]